MKIDRMELADLGNCVAIAKAVLQQNPNLTLPIDIIGLAHAAGIDDVQIQPLKGMEGALIADDMKQRGTILVNQSRHARERFTIGHELGHFLNFWHKAPEGKFHCSREDMYASGEDTARLKMEAEANKFAAEILMPEMTFRQDITRTPSPGLEHIADWAKRRYETSTLATVRRFVDLNDSPSALVASKYGVIGQCHRHQSFPFISLKYGQQVPRHSLTATFDGGADGCSDTDSIESSLWTTNTLNRGVEMLEQVLVQGNGYRITLLTLDESESEDEDEEYARERSEWNPRFKR